LITRKMPAEKSRRQKKFSSMRRRPKDTETDRQNLLDYLMSVYERFLIKDALRQARGNAALAAEILGTTKRVIQLRVSKYQIDLKEFFQNGKRKNRPKKTKEDS
jgi:transcriptional regulator with GAF, ATPase, and Fis domain